MVIEKRINEAYEWCVKKFTSSDVNSYVYKISKIYLDLLVLYSTINCFDSLFFLRFKSDNFEVYSIYRSEDGDMLDPAHTEIDVILKACSYIVEGLRKSLIVKQRWLV